MARRIDRSHALVDFVQDLAGEPELDVSGLDVVDGASHRLDQVGDGVGLVDVGGEDDGPGMEAGVVTAVVGLAERGAVAFGAIEGAMSAEFKKTIGHRVCSFLSR